MTKQLYEIISNVLGTNASEINDESSPKTIKSWDSFNNLLLLNEIEKEYSISIDFEDFTKSESVKEIKTLLEKYDIQA